jgi:cell division septation protein DedD
MLLYLMAAAYDFDVSVMTLPAAPPRAPHPTLTLPGVPSPWLTSTAAGRPKLAPPIVAATTGDRFAIQVASFATQARADTLLDELTRDGFPARAVTVDFGPPRGQLVQVLVGGYGSAEEAASDLAKVRERFADAHLEPVAAR